MLDTELQTLQFDTSATPSQAMVRAGHTLCGIHRTVGFPLVASTAKVLEQCLLALQERGAPLPSVALPVLARAIAALRMLVGRVGNREAFNAVDETEAAEITAELDVLRQEAAPEPQLDDSETVAERIAEADEVSLLPAKLVAMPPPVESPPEPAARPAAEPHQSAVCGSTAHDAAGRARRRGAGHVTAGAERASPSAERRISARHQR